MTDQNNKVDKITGIFCYYIAPLVMAVMLFSGFGRMFFDSLDMAALLLFTLTLLAKPMAVIFKIKFFEKIIHLRKELGDLVFWLFSFHLAGMLYFSDNMMLVSKDMSWGILAEICLLMMAVLSNNYIGRLLKVDWSKFRFVAFITFLFVLLHIGTQEGKIAESIAVFSFFVVLKTIEFWKLRKKPEIPK